MNELMVAVTCRDCDGSGKGMDTNHQECRCGRCDGYGTLFVPASVAKEAAAQAALRSAA